MGEAVTSLRILVVDDSENFCDSFVASLKEIGIVKVQTAKNGREALAMTEAAYDEGTPFSMIFCDWNMPELNGLEVLKNLRSSEKQKGILVAMVTTDAEKSKVLEAITVGANDYIFKPVDTPTLRRKITRLISLLQKS